MRSCRWTVSSPPIPVISAAGSPAICASPAYAVDIVQFPDTDFAAIARGYGTRAATVRTLSDLDPLKAWVAEGAPGVFVIDGKINPALEADWHAEHFPS